MDLKALSQPLRGDQIELRVSHKLYGNNYMLLVYKDARADMERLDEAVGALNWKREHCRDNHNCIVSIWNAEIGEWISKEDTGTESKTEATKGLASDSFKRACFNWGIGRELYDYPDIIVELADKEQYKIKEWRMFNQFDNGKLTFLAIKDHKDEIRFAWGDYNEDLV